MRNNRAIRNVYQGVQNNQIYDFKKVEKRILKIYRRYNDWFTFHYNNREFILFYLRNLVCQLKKMVKYIHDLEWDDAFL